ncbi:hypothetical protein AK812_SmicGene4577 [Symbiodinium microadriaticum]|uniref:Uncharacterized protein n=1 Tax=Symbiodinium microadriaticum TaxID=2951 RepID=A0A1Q9EVZ8_SYMMI|nr:hypothetical protein AK812_SmicGene4577 [Symbiodinium microadriaticum]
MANALPIVGMILVLAAAAATMKAMLRQPEQPPAPTQAFNPVIGPTEVPATNHCEMLFVSPGLRNVACGLLAVEKGLLLCTPSGVLNQSSNVSVDMAITVARRLTHLRLEDAKASKAADKQTIDDLVSSYEGGHEAMNHFVREHIHNALKRAPEAQTNPEALTRGQDDLRKLLHRLVDASLPPDSQASTQPAQPAGKTGCRSATVPAQVSSSRSGSLVLSSRGIPQSPASSLRSDDEACSSDESSDDDKELRSAGNPPEGGWQSWVSAHLGSRLVSIPSSLFSRRHWEEPGP